MYLFKNQKTRVGHITGMHISKTTCMLLDQDRTTEIQTLRCLFIEKIRTGVPKQTWLGIEPGTHGDPSPVTTTITPTRTEIHWRTHGCNTYPCLTLESNNVPKSYKMVTKCQNMDKITHGHKTLQMNF